MRWGNPGRSKVVLFVGDISLVFLAVYLGAFLRLGEPINVLRDYTGATIVFAFTFLSLLYVFDFYNLASLFDRQRTLLRLVVACAAGTLVSGTSFYFLPPYKYGRGIFLLSVLLLLLSIYLWRGLYTLRSDLLVSGVPTLVLGIGPSAEVLRGLLMKTISHYELLGFVRTEKGGTEPAVPFAEVLGDITALRTLIAARGVRCLVATNEPLAAEFAPTLTQLKFQGVRICPAIEFAMRIAEQLPLELLSDSWLSFAEGFEVLQSQGARNIKRLSDLLLATVGLLVTLPVSVLAAFAVKLESRGPVLLRQQRVGRLGQSFELLKFRSMHVDAEVGGNPQWASVNDPRATRVGRLLRKLHIDEIPQMLNVLRGEMSFVGPRPERPEFVEQLKGVIPFYDLRHYIPPGITGWAQVNYSYGASLEDAKRKLEFDLYYIANASPLFDIRIALRTIRAVLFLQGSR